jgi:hypothetical protein
VRRRSSGLVGIALVALGLLVVGLNIREDRDPVVLSLTTNHGLHLSDFVGSAIVFLGVWFVWNRR